MTRLPRLAAVVLAAMLLAPAQPAAAVDAGTLVLDLQIACTSPPPCATGFVMGDGTVTGVVGNVPVVLQAVHFEGLVSYILPAVCEFGYTMTGVLDLGPGGAVDADITSGHVVLAAMTTSRTGLSYGTSVVTNRTPATPSPCLAGGPVLVHLNLTGLFGV